ncbi:hypothetical protein ACFYUL_07105 [Streptomyces sp. NPDC004311]|uniref:hypothetical protein n=1 Tax=Streptomyces sp. NPDC004311 TaxID=3364698 RepID=UPI0036BCC7EC
MRRGKQNRFARGGRGPLTVRPAAAGRAASSVGRAASSVGRAASSVGRARPEPTGAGPVREVTGR